MWQTDSTVVPEVQQLLSFSVALVRHCDSDSCNNVWWSFLLLWTLVTCNLTFYISSSRFNPSKVRSLALALKAESLALKPESLALDLRVKSLLTSLQSSFGWSCFVSCVALPVGTRGLKFSGSYCKLSSWLDDDRCWSQWNSVHLLDGSHFYAFATRQCERRQYVFGLSVLSSVCSSGQIWLLIFHRCRSDEGIHVKAEHKCSSSSLGLVSEITF